MPRWNKYIEDFLRKCFSEKMEVEWGQAGEIIRPQWRFDFSDGKKKGMLDGTVLDHHASLRKVCQGHQKLWSQGCLLGVLCLPGTSLSWYSSLVHSLARNSLREAPGHKQQCEFQSILGHLTSKLPVAEDLRSHWDNSHRHPSYIDCSVSFAE